MISRRTSAAVALGAALSLAVAGIHVADQRGFPGSEDPSYLQWLYYALEAGAVVTAVALVAIRGRLPWAAALLLALSPLIGYVLSRGPGLPGAGDDKGKWGEPLGIASLAVEALLGVLAVTILVARRRAPVARVPEARAPATGRFRRTGTPQGDRVPL